MRTSRKGKRSEKCSDPLYFCQAVVLTEWMTTRWSLKALSPRIFLSVLMPISPLLFRGLLYLCWAFKWLLQSMPIFLETSAVEHLGNVAIWWLPSTPPCAMACVLFVTICSYSLGVSLCVPQKEVLGYYHGAVSLQVSYSMCFEVFFKVILNCLLLYLLIVTWLVNRTCWDTFETFCSPWLFLCFTMYASGRVGGNWKSYFWTCWNIKLFFWIGQWLLCFEVMT